MHWHDTDLHRHRVGGGPAAHARPEQVGALFRHVVEVGVAFGVVRVRERPADGEPVHEIEVATFRADLGYSDGRRPDAVRFTDARADVARRDFTLNGLLVDPLDCDDRGARVLDYVGGLADLEAGLLRAIGEPEQRFTEDALRLLRAPRFAARFGLRVEGATASAIRQLAPSLARVSRERIAIETRAMLTAPTAVAAIHLWAELGLDVVLWPQLVDRDAGLRETAASFQRLEAQVHPESAPGQLAIERDVSWPLALAIVGWPTRDLLGVDDLALAWKLSRADAQDLRETWQLAEGLQAHPERVARVRLLREPMADAALRLLAARAAPDSVEAKDESDLIVALGPHVDGFVATLFGIEAETQAQVEQSAADAGTPAESSAAVAKEPENAPEATGEAQDAARSAESSQGDAVAAPREEPELSPTQKDAL